MASKGPLLQVPSPCIPLVGKQYVEAALFGRGGKEMGTTGVFFPQRNLRPAEKGGPTKQPDPSPGDSHQQGSLGQSGPTSRRVVHTGQSSPGRGGSQHPV